MASGMIGTIQVNVAISSQYICITDKCEVKMALLLSFYGPRKVEVS